jgi:hypothetical protein
MTNLETHPKYIMYFYTHNGALYSAEDWDSGRVAQQVESPEPAA